ncbi:MAG: tetratricopeptide repeat protein [Terriglobales bacterium]
MISRLAGGHYSTMKPVSSIRVRTVGAWLLFLFFSWHLAVSQQAAPPVVSGTNTRAWAAAPHDRDPRQLFEAGETALRGGKLDEAEQDFQQVLAVNPGVAGAYANLGVIYMRRKQWPQALAMLHKAEKLAPEMAGIRLNIGLVHFRQNDFARAIQPFESVVRQSPDSYQARYLLGLCYFFNDRWTDAIDALEPLWGKASDQLNYLYVLEHAADNAKNAALEEKAARRLVEIGEGSPEFHLLMGKGHMNRGEYDDALKELETAAQADPRLPFVHFNLGLAYVHKQDYARAREEFHKDIAIEPDVSFNYAQLGSLEATAGNEDEAANNYRIALKLDPQSVSSHLGLAKIEEHQKHYAAALVDLDEVIRLDNRNAGARYLRGQVLVRMGSEKEGREELASAAKMLNEQRAARHRELEGDVMPSPELAREPQ